MSEWINAVDELPPRGVLVRVKLGSALGAYEFPFDCALCSDGHFHNVRDPAMPVRLVKRVVAWRSAGNGEVSAP